MYDVGSFSEARDVVSGTTPRGVLRLGALESTTASRLPPILAGFHTRYRDVRLELVTGTNDVLLTQLAERRLDAAFIADALGMIARARGMTQIARDAGLGRESLYKALSVEGNPEFATILRVVQALGLRLSALPAAKPVP